jgi:hypothetical protein
MITDLRRRIAQGRDCSPVTCPGCGAEHPVSYTLIGCGVGHCEAVGCHVCMAECGIANHGRFCDLHLNEIDLGTNAHPLLVNACLICESESQAEAEAA